MLVAILPNNNIRYFDVQSKTWKALSSMQKLADTFEHSGQYVYRYCCAELIGNCLYVAACVTRWGYVVYCYDIVNNVWSCTSTKSWLLYVIKLVSLCHIEDHLYVIYKSSAPYRFNLTTNQWQPIASSKAVCKLGEGTFCNKTAAVYKSCLYVLYGQGQIINPIIGIIYCSSSVLFRFDPKKNRWEQKASTKTPHFGSSLFVVGNNLCVAGGDAHSKHHFCTI